MARNVRRSIIAGQWYPGTARELWHTIDAFLADVPPVDIDDRIVGLISPHAGYVYSGRTAAYAYAQVRGRSYDVVAVLSPLHRLPLGRFAVTSASAYETPLGLAELDEGLVELLSQEVTVNRVAYDGEHSLEIQIPFLQVALSDWKLLPVMVGDSSFETAAELSAALAKILADKRALIVASSDLHHIEDYRQVVQRDQAVVDAIGSFDLARVKDVLSPWDCSVCGRIPVYAMLAAAKELGADRAKVLHHTNSGDVTGVRTPGQYTVGYMAAAVYQAQ